MCATYIFISWQLLHHLCSFHLWVVKSTLNFCYIWFVCSIFVHSRRPRSVTTMLSDMNVPAGGATKQVSDVNDTMPTRFVGSRRRTICMSSKDFPVSPRLAGPKRRKTTTPAQQHGSQLDVTPVPSRLVSEILQNDRSLEGDNASNNQHPSSRNTNHQPSVWTVETATTSTSATLTIPPHNSKPVAPIEQDVDSDDEDTYDIPDIISGAINGLLSGEHTQDDDVSDPNRPHSP